MAAVKRLWPLALILGSAVAVALTVTTMTLPATGVLRGATIIGDGGLVVQQIPASELDLNYNVGTPSGSGPSLTLCVTPVDPQNLGSVLTGDTAACTSAIFAAGAGELVVAPVHSSAVNVQWLLGGTGSILWPGVYVTLSAKNPLSPASP